VGSKVFVYSDRRLYPLNACYFCCSVYITAESCQSILHVIYNKWSFFYVFRAIISSEIYYPSYVLL
jgi:hypothetical protein